MAKPIRIPDAPDIALTTDDVLQELHALANACVARLAEWERMEAQAIAQTIAIGVLYKKQLEKCSPERRAMYERVAAELATRMRAGRG